jgi:voltage-gated sodium channel
MVLLCPGHRGSLSQAFLTLFQMLTLEGWVEIQASGMEALPLARIYYASFVVVAVFVVINLFIAVVLDNLERDLRTSRRGET